MIKKILLFFFPLLAVAATGLGQCTVTVTNASFETPVLQIGMPGNTVSGWTNSQTVFVWRSANNPGPFPFPPNALGPPDMFLAKAGSQFVELGVGQGSTLYQDIPTPSSAQLTITFSHRGQGGGANGNKDECELYAGSPNGSLTFLKTISDNNAAWGSYTVVYTVPVGQPVTRLQFFGGPTASGTNGNFLDDIQIVTDNSIHGSNSISLSCTANQTTVVTGGLSGSWVQDITNPSVSTVNATVNAPAFTTSAVISGFVLPGIYHYTWHTGYCDTPLTITVATTSAVTPTLSYNTPVYSGNILSLSSTASAGASYSWRGPSGFSSTSQSSTVSNNALASMSGIYSLTATLLNSCSAQALTASIPVTVIPVTITISPAIVSLNGGSSVTLSVNIAPAVTTGSQTITLSASGNAVSGTHYTGLPSQVIIPAGASSVSFTIAGLNNNIVNAVNNLVIQASSAYYASGSATVTIVDITGNDPANRLISVSSGVLTETLSRTLTLSLTGSVTTYGPITITIIPSSVLPSGYTISPNPVVIQGGGHSATFSIQSASDDAIADNYFSIGGTAVSGGAATFTVIAGALTVANKNQSLTINPITPTVGNTVSVTVSRSAAGAGALSYSVTSSIGGGSATIDAFGNLTTIRVGSITLVVSSLGDSNYLAATTTRLVNIAKVTPILAITSGTSMTVGDTLQAITTTTATVSSGGAISFVITSGSGSASVTPGGLITAIGGGTVTLTANSLGDINYNGASTSTLITILPGSQSLSLSSSSGDFGTSVGGSITVTASSSVAGGGSIMYSILGGSGSATVDVDSGFVKGLRVGTVILEASVLSNGDYVGATTTTILTIGISSQTLTINPPVIVSVGNSITVSATRLVTDTLKGGSLSYTLIASGSGSATIDEVSGNLRGVGAGTLTVMVTALGNTNYYSSASNTLMVTIRKGTPTLSLTSTIQSVNMTVGGVLSLTATSTPPASDSPGSTGGISFSIVTGSQSATLDASTGQLTAVRTGQIVVQVIQASDANYNAPLAVTLMITIKKGTPTLSLSSTTQSAAMTVGSVLSLTTTSTPPAGAPLSTGSIVFSIVTGSQSASINGLTGQLTAIRSGTIVVRAIQGSDINYNAPVASTLTITIGKSTPSLSLSSTTTAIAVGDVLTIVGRSVPSLPGGIVLSTGSISFSVIPSLVGGGSATIDGAGELSAKASGSVLVQAIQGSDENYYESMPGTLSIMINSGGQVIAFSSSNYTMVVDQLRTITPTNSVLGGGGITYSVSSGSGSATVNENTGEIRAVGAGTVTLMAQAASNSNYTLASTSALLVIGKGSQSLSISPSTSIVSIGQTLSLSTTSTATGGRGGAIVYKISGGSGSATVNSLGLVSAISEGTVNLEASTSGDGDYDGASVSRVLAIVQGAQTLTITSSSSTVVGGSIPVSVTTTASASDGGIGVSTYDLFSSGSGSATIDPLTHVIRGVESGTVLLMITAPGDGNYGGVSVTQSITIGKGTPTLLVGAPTTTLRVDDTLSITASSLAAFTGGVASVGLISYRIVNTIGEGSATINMSTGVLEAQSVGGVVVEVSQGSDNNYYSPAPVTLTITINQGVQSLQITSDDFMGLYGSISAVVSTTAKRGGGLISYSISNATGMGSVTTDGLITASQLGKVTLIASTLGDTNYGPASTSQVISIVSLSMRPLTQALVEGASGSVTLSLNPIGTILSKDVVFNLVGSLAKSGHYILPSTVTLQNGQTELSIPIGILSDKILYNSEALVLVASNSNLGSASSSLSITDGTGLDPANLVITIKNGIIYSAGGTLVEASLPVGVRSAVPIVVGLRIGDRSEFNLLGGMPQVSSIVTIAGDEQSNSGIFSVTATSANENSARIIIEGLSVSVAGNSVSFTAIKEGVVTVINQKVVIVRAMSINGDGTNDCFMVDNVDKYPDNEVSILSRSGLVYQAHGYNNRDVIFCGKPNRGASSKLERGTYYYVIRFTDSASKTEEVFKGFLEVRPPAE